MKKTNSELIAILDDIISTKTEYEISSFTGASVSNTITHSNTQIKYFLVLFFGYSNRNSVQKKISINEDLYYMLSKAIVLKVKSLKKEQSSDDIDDILTIVSKTNRTNSSNTPNYNTNLNNKVTNNKLTAKIEKPLEERTIDYFNKITGKKNGYTDYNLRGVKARIKEGYGEDDFAKVIRVKFAEWTNDNKMKKYITPSTFFGEKFDKYLNQDEVIGASISDVNIFDELERFEDGK